MKIKITLSKVLWAFSIYLESVAILPQLFQLTRTGESETITVKKFRFKNNILGTLPGCIGWISSFVYTQLAL